MYGNGLGLGSGRVDMEHLLSTEQIDIVKKTTNCGDEISFLKDDVHIEGTIDKKYKNLFTLKDGRSFTWIDYIIGSPDILHYLRIFHPIETVKFQNSYNLYRMNLSGIK